MQTGSHIKSSSPLLSQQRRQAIIEAVKDVFAKKGFDETTSRELGKAAGISEALLYKYFPTKLLLYNAMLHTCAEASELVSEQSHPSSEAFHRNAHYDGSFFNVTGGRKPLSIF
jgi:AcrR family transcriptional regulator